MSVRGVDLSSIDGSGGVVWSVSLEGFHTNLVVLDSGGSMGSDPDDAADVLSVVLAGAGRTGVDDETVHLAPATAVLVPGGAVRSIAAGGDGLRHLTVHQQRVPLGTGMTGHDGV